MLREHRKTILLFIVSIGAILEINCHGNSHHDSLFCANKYSAKCNSKADSEMYERGHLKPFGSHSPPESLVEELKYSISPQDFYMNYVIKHKPVVIKGAVKYWPAYSKWTDEYLNSTYGHVDFLMETKDDDKLNIPPAMNLSFFLQTYQTVNRYLVDEVSPDMRKDVTLPLELRCEEMSSYFFVSYFWMSNGGTSSKIHLDTDENLLCVIRGHKKVILVSPEYSNDLYSDESYQLGVSDIDPKSVDMDKFPRVKNVRYTLANVEEGDIVYIPQMWWHQVISRKERQQAVALWWKSKPRWMNEAKKAVPHPVNPDAKKNKYSYAKALSDYERWVQNVSTHVPRIKCTSQQSMMSDYQWETDKVANAPVTYGNGGIEEEEMIINKRSKEHFNAKDLYERPSCDFDKSNSKSPCHFEACQLEDEDPKCIRYTLDYCAVYQDRGCVIQLPHVMNKKRQDEYKTIKQMNSEF